MLTIDTFVNNQIGLKSESVSALGHKTDLTLDYQTNFCVSGSRSQRPVAILDNMLR
jgi:hypothetical protein